jgi:hypothetical protein
MHIFPDNTVIILVSSFYHGMAAAKDAVVGGVFGAIWQGASGALDGKALAIVPLPGLLYITWKIKTWVPAFIFKKLF